MSLAGPWHKPRPAVAAAAFWGVPAAAAMLSGSRFYYFSLFQPTPGAAAFAPCSRVRISGIGAGFRLKTLRFEAAPAWHLLGEAALQALPSRVNGAILALRGGGQQHKLFDSQCRGSR
jgi:hypothetical protein